MTRRSFLVSCAYLPSLMAAPAGDGKIASAVELKALLAKEGPRLFVLDVREPQELVRDGALAGHHNIPLKEVEARLAEIPRNKPILVYCSKGVRAEWAADKLRRRGYRVRASAGLEDWRAKNYPLVYPGVSGKK